MQTLLYDYHKGLQLRSVSLNLTGAFPNFIQHAMIESYTTSPRRFIKNDCLKFKIKCTCTDNTSSAAAWESVIRDFAAYHFIMGDHYHEHGIIIHYYTLLLPNDMMSYFVCP